MHPIVRAALSLTLLPAWSVAQKPGPVVVLGVVRNTSGRPVPGAEVWIERTPHRAVSNDSGEFRLEGAPSGHVSVMVRRLGYYPDGRRLRLEPGDTGHVTFNLEALPGQLDTVLVRTQADASGRLQEFWDRRAAGLGVFITRGDIERRKPAQTADIFRTVMGIRVIPRGGNGEPTRLVTGRSATVPPPRRFSAATNPCIVQYYLDGIYLSPGTFSVDDIAPEQIEAIEVFRGPAEIPARFRTRDTGCGLVIIWTREPPPRKAPADDASQKPTDGDRRLPPGTRQF